MDVETLALVLALHVLEGNFEICLESLVIFSEACNSSQFGPSCHRHILGLLAALAHEFEQLLRLIPNVIALKVIIGQDLLISIVEVLTALLVSDDFYRVAHHFCLYVPV